MFNICYYSITGVICKEKSFTAALCFGRLTDFSGAAYSGFSAAVLTAKTG